MHIISSHEPVGGGSDAPLPGNKHNRNLESQELSSWLSTKSKVHPLHHYTVIPSDIINYSPDKSQSIMNVHNIFNPRTIDNLFVLYSIEMNTGNIPSELVNNHVLEAMQNCMLQPSHHFHYSSLSIILIIHMFATVTSHSYFIATFHLNILMLGLQPIFLLFQNISCFFFFFS